MANHFRENAEQLRKIAETADLSADEKETLESAAKTLCRLEQMKRDLIGSDHDCESTSDRLAADLMSLLGIHAAS